MSNARPITHIVRAWTILSLLTFRLVQPYAADLDTVRLAIGFIPHIQFAPLYVGMEKGFYEQEGIDLTVQYGFGMDVFSLILAGKIDVGLSDSDQLIIAGSKGMNLKAVFQYYQRYPVTIVARRSRVATPEAFAGKTIGTAELFGTSYIGLLLFLDHYKIRDKVTIQRIGYTQISSLLSDRVDGVVCFYNNEPLSPDLNAVETVQWNVKDISDVVGASFISSETIIGNRAGAIRRFVSATRKAIEYTVANQAEALVLSRKFIGPIKEG